MKNDEINAEALRIAEEAGKYLSLGVASGLTENNKYVIEAFRGMLEKLNYQRDFDIISEAEYYRRLENLRDRYFSKGTQNWVKYTQEIYEYQKKTLEVEKENIVKLYDDIAEYATGKFDAILKKQQAAAEEIGSFGGLFNVNKVIMGDTTDTYYSLHDLEYDIEMIRKFGESFTELESRINSLGVSGEGGENILDAIRGMDTEDALGFMSALLYTQDAEFVKYAQNLKFKESLSKGVAARLYEAEFAKGWDDAYANMKKQLSDAGYEIPEGFFTSGSISAEKFGQGFVAGLDAQMAIVRAKIEEFNASIETDFPSTNINTYNTSYNITSSGGDTVEQIQRMETVKRLSGV